MTRHMREDTVAPIGDDAEVRLMGLILAQSAMVGVAIGLYVSDVWITAEGTVLNGVLYGGTALAFQVIAYYVFKVFFQRGMDERARTQHAERNRSSRYRERQIDFDRRREDLELRRMEMEMEAELRFMEQNPNAARNPYGVVGDSFEQTHGAPKHASQRQQALDLGASKTKKSPTRGPDGKFASEKATKDDGE